MTKDEARVTALHHAADLIEVEACRVFPADTTEAEDAKIANHLRIIAHKLRQDAEIFHRKQERYR